MKLNALEWISLILVIIGAINWGFLGIFEFNLVAALFGELSALSRVVYILVGIAAVYIIVDGLVRSSKARHPQP